jgi:hypothetical protein
VLALLLAGHMVLLLVRVLLLLLLALLAVVAEHLSPAMPTATDNGEIGAQPNADIIWCLHSVAADDILLEMRSAVCQFEHLCLLELRETITR